VLRTFVIGHFAAVRSAFSKLSYSAEAGFLPSTSLSMTPTNPDTPPATSVARR